MDDVVGAASVAKGTFYVHFDSLAELQGIVADELAREFDELLQPRRRALDDPIERIAAGCGAFIMQTLRNPSWGSLVAHSAAAMPSVAGVARKRLKEDIDRAARDGQLNGVTPELAFNFANGIMLHTMLSAPQNRRLTRASARGGCRHSPRHRSCAEKARGGRPAWRTGSSRSLKRREARQRTDQRRGAKPMAANLARLASPDSGPRWGVVQRHGRRAARPATIPTTAALIEHGEERLAQRAAARRLRCLRCTREFSRP